MFSNILFVGSVGSVLFTLWLILFHLSGWVGFVRTQKGAFQKKWSWKAVIAILIFITFLVGILVWGNMRLFHASPQLPSTTQLFLNGFGIFLFIHLYDLVVIDYLIIVKWHPKFLKLPDTTYYKTIKPHVKGFFRGIPIGILASMAATLIRPGFI